MRRKRYQINRRRPKYFIYRTEVNKFNNPFSRREKKKNLKFKVYCFFVLAIILVLGYFAFYSNIFKIENIEIVGARNVPPDDIRSLVEASMRGRRLLFLPQNNLLALSKEGLKEDIGNKYVLDDLVITKKLPKTITIELKERISVAIWVSNNRFYNIDSSGVVISEILDLNQPSKTKKAGETAATEPQAYDITIDNQQFNSFPFIYDESNAEIKLGQQIVPGEMISIILDLAKRIQAKTGISIASFRMSDAKSKELKAITTEGWAINFDTAKDLEMQLDVLKQILAKKAKSNSKILEYIDLRYGSKVFVK